MAEGATVGDAARPRRVFISYAHDSPEHGELVRDLWVLLRKCGIDAKVDRVAAEQRQDWTLWMGEQIREADHILVVASKAYRERAENGAGPDGGRGVQWEARLIRNAFYADQRVLDRFVPVVLPGQSVEGVPDFLTPATTTVYHVEDFTVDGAAPLLRLLLRQPFESESRLGPVPDLGRRVRSAAEIDPFATAPVPGARRPAPPPGESPAWPDWAARATVVAGIALVLALSSLLLRETPGGDAASSSSIAPATSPVPVPEPVRTQQPAATFGCNDTDNRVTSVAVHPDGLVVACASQYRATAVWSIDTGSPSLAKNLGGSAKTVTFDPAGSVLLTSGGSCWELFEVGQPWGRLGEMKCGLEDSANAVAFAPDGTTFAAIPSIAGTEIRFWNVASQEIVNTYKADNDKRFLSIAYSGTGRYVATGSEDAHSYLWDLHDNGRRVRLENDRAGHSGAVRSVAFSPDETRLVTGGADRTAKIWNVADGTLLASLDGEHGDYVNAVAFAPDGLTVVTGGEDGSVVVWDVATRKPVRKLEGGGSISSLSFDRGGKVLAAGCSGGRVAVWRLA